MSIHIQPGNKHFGIGNHVFRGKIHDLSVDEHHQITIHENPSLGGRTHTSLLQAGDYPHIYMRHGWGWLDKDDRSRLLEIKETKLEQRELLQLLWWQRNRDGEYKKQNVFLGPGTYTGRGHENFLNDRIESIRAPSGGSILIYEHADEGGRYIELGPGYHKLKDYNLYKEVSSIVFCLDAWEEISVEFGTPRGKHKIGQTQIHNVDMLIPEGRSSVSVSIGKARMSEVEYHWEVSSEITTSTEVTAKYGGAELKQTVAATIGASGGESKTKGDEDTFSVSVEVEPDENNRVQGAVAVDLYEAVVPMIRKLKNKRTGNIIENEGEARAAYFESKGNFLPK